MTFRNFLRSLEVMITKVGYNDDDVGDEFEDDTAHKARYFVKVM